MPRKIKSPTSLTSSQVRVFRQKVYAYFARACRSLPWRFSTDPYQILVSEIMLQQTQVDRVVEKFTLFISRFATIGALAEASTADVLSAWQGLGYNRRALMLHTCAKEIVSDYGGVIPSDPEILQTLPGIGPATASAIAAYAFNSPTVYIETNIRAVFIHHFFPGETTVSDKRISTLVARTLDRKSPARWYNALMDYGVMLKKEQKNPARRSSHYAKQSRFEGSNRQVRGQIVRMLIQKKHVSKISVCKDLDIEPARLEEICSGLAKEGFLREERAGYGLV